METPPTPLADSLDAGLGRELFSGAGDEIAEADYRGDQRRLYVTEFLGHGANLVTGDYSRGASACGSSMANWRIRSKITVAGISRDVLQYFRDWQRSGIPGQRGLADNSQDDLRSAEIAEHCGINLFVTFPVSFA